LVEVVHVLPGGGGIEPDDDAGVVALEQPVSALLTDVFLALLQKS
jgi:hypothetical protein